MSQQLDEEAFKTHLTQKENWWIGLSKEKQGDFVIPYYVLGQDWQIVLADQEFEGLLVMPFAAPYQINFEKWKRDVEKTLFYGSVNLDQSESLFSYYEPIYRVIIQGNLQQIIDELTLLEKIVLENTPRVSITKQLFTQFVMDVFHLFEHLKADDMTDIVKNIHAITTFEDLVAYTKETNSTFAELLNKQRIKAAQQLLLSTNDSIEDICYTVGYSNVGYFYKVFRKLCGKSPKAYRKQVETNL